MSWLNKLERRLEPFAISNLSLCIVIGQTFVYLSVVLGLLDPRNLMLVAGLVTRGEPWRVLTFVFLPPGYSLLTAFGLYLFYLYGNALEAYWGKGRYNLFIFIGYLLTVGCAFVTPYAAITNIYIAGSVFLAFAFLNPDFELLIFFILPVKIKWLAILTWALYTWQFVSGPLSIKLSIAAGVANFLLFFSRDLFLGARAGSRRMQSQARRFSEERAEAQPRHRCHICGKTDLSNPEMDFRYCSKCAGDECYCPEHIFKHTHVTADEEAKP